LNDTAASPVFAFEIAMSETTATKESVQFVFALVEPVDVPLPRA
jgi:hypothetical protein